MAELINKWDVVSKLITLENEYNFFKGSADALSAEKMYRRICGLEMEIGKTSGIELVRCKNCVHMKKQFGARYCEVWTMFNGMGDDGFCNYGERKNDG